MDATAQASCPYCGLDGEGRYPTGGWIHRDDNWLVSHGPAEASRPAP